jgi:hypothetical protein
MNPKQKAKNRFIRAAKELNSALEEARQEWPKAEMYLAVSTLNLMSGPHHEGKLEDAKPERILASVKLKHTDGGDW